MLDRIGIMHKIINIIIVATLVILNGCATKVMVPPKIDLIDYEIIGLVEFSSNSEGKLDTYITQRYIEAMSQDQPGIKIIELGNEEEILDEFGFDYLNPEALRAIGERYTIKTLITGILDLSEPSSDIDFWGGLSNMTVSTDVAAILTVKMKDTASGATVWSASGRDTREISDVGFFGGNIHFDAEDPDEAYGKLAEKLVKEVTEDFRVTWRRESK